MKSFLIYPYFEKIVLEDQIFFEPQKDLMELCDSMNIGFWVYHAETKSVYSNQTFFELLGLEVNKNTSNLQYITSLVEIDELRELKKILKTKKIEDLNGFEYKLKYTANVFSRAIKLKCIFKEIKSQKFLYIYIADITSSIDMLRSRFLSEITHDLRLPVNTIIQCIDNLVDFDNEQMNLYINILKQSASHLKELGEHYLNYSIDTSVLNLKATRFNLWQLFQSLELIHSVGIDEKLSLSMTTPKDSRHVYMDKFCLEQVMNNLISNAKKYTPQGAIAFGYCFRVDGGLDIFVSDTGKGISEEDQQKIFEPYYQKEKGIGGVGLGLSICKRIIDKMEGNISIHSRENFGTRFVITLPSKVMATI